MNFKITSFLFVLFIFMLFLGLFTDTKSIKSPLIDKKFPKFSINQIESNTQFTNNDFPKESFLINVWASWCLECIREHQVLNDINKEGKTKIIGINYKDSMSDAKGWLEIYGNPYIYNLYDFDGKLGLDLGVYGVPETFLIDKSGFIREKYIGAISKVIYINDILPKLNKMNNEK